MLHLPSVLTPAEVCELRQRAARAPWLDGRNPAGGEALEAKRNEQLLFEMAQALALLNDVAGTRPEFLRLTGIYQRLVQMWARP